MAAIGQTISMPAEGDVPAGQNRGERQLTAADSAEPHADDVRGVQENMPLPASSSDSAWLRFFGWPGLLALLVLVADQASKWLVVTHWPVGTVRTVIPGFFNLVHVRNPGAAWGILAEHTWLLGVLSLAAFVAIVIFFRRLHEGSRLAAMALGAVQGGIAGNLIDRWVRHSVVDFLDFHLGGMHWPAFNIADSAICVGVTLLVLWSFIGARRQTPSKA
ncbi:MAG: signal peptidase II [Lentisphaeria bacterium]|jgi:signal peptidase II